MPYPSFTLFPKFSSETGTTSLPISANHPNKALARHMDEGEEKIFVIETRGDQLAGNLDSQYKHELLKLMADNYRQGRASEAGMMEVDMGGKTTVTCDLVLMSEWKNREWE